MQKLDHLPARTIFPPVKLDDSAVHVNRRLVVLVSNSEMDAPAVARRILEIANAFQCSVLFLGLCSDQLQESSLRRQLVILSAMVRDEAILFETRVEIGKDWLNLVRANSAEGDVFVCFSRQKAGTRGSMQNVLLKSGFASSIYVLEDLSPFEPGRASWVSAALAWTGSLFIILAFLWFQINSLSGTLMFILSLPVEAGLILAWNSLLEPR